MDATATFGKLLRLPGLSDVQVLTPREQDLALPNTYSGNYGCKSFPLHSDLAHWAVPPRFLLLRCINGSEGVATRLLHGNDVIAAVGKSDLERALVQPRRPVANALPLLRLLECSTAGTRLRWDRLFITPATPSSVEVFASMSRYVNMADPTEIVLGQSGDTLVIDNWRMLHGRGPVADDATDRRLERTYFDEML